jgi:hypothetical protein
MMHFAGVAKLVDAQDLKSCSPQGECRFDSGPRHTKRDPRALSSVWLERFLDMEEVTGSNPVEPTTLMLSMQHEDSEQSIHSDVGGLS